MAAELRHQASNRLLRVLDLLVLLLLLGSPRHHLLENHLLRHLPHLLATPVAAKAKADPAARRQCCCGGCCC